MNELISDTYLFDHGAERVESTVKIENNSHSPPEEIAADDQNAWRGYEKDYIYSNVGVWIPEYDFDEIILKTDLSELDDISNIDLELYIGNLNEIQKKLNSSADSLKTKADKFYQAAEKKRKELHK
jgi:hypothetical protein